MWRFGVFPGRGVLPYVAAQLMGSLLGVLLARAAWGPSLAEPSVAYAALKPAPGWSNGMVFLVEGASMAVIIVLVGVSCQYLGWFPACHGWSAASSALPLPASVPSPADASTSPANSALPSSPGNSGSFPPTCLRRWSAQSWRRGCSVASGTAKC
jgi:glycerol uptake facilitator-like aquaporin